MTFEEFWVVYDHKKAKVAAQRAWNKLTLDEKSTVHHNVQSYVDSTTTNYEARGSGKRFRAHAASYLNGKFFNDEIKKKPKRNKFKARYNTATPEEIARVKRGYERLKKEGKERMKKRKEEGWKPPLAGQRTKKNLGYD